MFTAAHVQGSHRYLFCLLHPTTIGGAKEQQIARISGKVCKHAVLNVILGLLEEFKMIFSEFGASRGKSFPPCCMLAAEFHLSSSALHRLLWGCVMVTTQPDWSNLLTWKRAKRKKTVIKMLFVFFQSCFHQWWRAAAAGPRGDGVHVSCQTGRRPAALKLCTRLPADRNTAAIRPPTPSDGWSKADPTASCWSHRYSALYSSWAASCQTNSQSCCCVRETCPNSEFNMKQSSESLIKTMKQPRKCGTNAKKWKRSWSFI